MEFVVIILQRFFFKNMEEATRIMLHVHQKGLGVCGVLPARWPRPRCARCSILPRNTDIRSSAPWNRNDFCMY